MKPLVSLLLMLSFTGCTLLQPLPEPDKREVITTPDAPSAIGPYSQAIKVGIVDDECRAEASDGHIAAIVTWSSECQNEDIGLLPPNALAHIDRLDGGDGV